MEGCPVLSNNGSQFHFANVPRNLYSRENINFGVRELSERLHSFG